MNEKRQRIRTLHSNMMSLLFNTTVIPCAITQSCYTSFSVSLDIKNLKLHERHLQCIIAWSCLLKCRGAFMTNVFFLCFALTRHLCSWQSKNRVLQGRVSTVPPAFFLFISKSFSHDKNGHLVKQCTWKSRGTKKMKHTASFFFFVPFQVRGSTLELPASPSAPVKKDGQEGTSVDMQKLFRFPKGRQHTLFAASGCHA